MVVHGLLAVAMTTVAGGCSLRLEDDAPTIPFVPRKSIPDEAYLLALYADTLAVAVATAPLTDTGSAAVRGLSAGHTEQARFLAEFLTARGVDVATAPTPSPTLVDGPALSVAIAAESRLLTAEALAPVATVTADNRALVMAVLSYRAAAATMLRRRMGSGEVTWPVLEGDDLAADAARALLDASRSTAYAMDLVAARTSGATRQRANESRGRLRLRIQAQQRVSGQDESAVPLAYTVTRPTTAAGARTLARRVLRALVRVGLASAPVTVGGASAVSLMSWQAQALVELAAWGSELPALPGLDVG